MAKKKIQKNKKMEVQDFITKIKELRKMDETILLEEPKNLNGRGYPVEFEWRGKVHKVQTLIGKWTILEPETEEIDESANENRELLRECYRVELENGYQVDISHEIRESIWRIMGIEPEFFDKIRKSTNLESE